MAKIDEKSHDSASAARVATRSATRARVFCTDALLGRCGERLSDRVDLAVWPGPGPVPPDELRRQAQHCDGLLCTLRDRIDAALLDASPRLRVVSTFSVGVNHIDLAAATARGIPVGHTPGVLVETTAELTFGLMLAAARRIAEADRFVRAGGWAGELGFAPDLMLGRDLHGATLGVVGLGAIGQAVARMARAFAMRVVGWTPSGRAVQGVESAPLEALLSRADFLTVHLALAPQTRGLIDAAAIARLPRGAFLVNTARGGIVDEAALVAALRDGRLGGAALDVYAREPLPPDDPLLDAPNVVLTPHIGSASRATRLRMADLAIDNLLAGLAGEALPRRANAEATARR